MLNGVEGKLFCASRKQHNNKESLATDLFERLNCEQSIFKTVFFSGTPSCKTSQKITYAKSRDEELETETEILRDRDETWDVRDRDRDQAPKNGSRDTSWDRDQVWRLHHWLAQRCLPMVGGAGLLKRDQKGCWGREKLRNAGLCHIIRTLC